MEYYLIKTKTIYGFASNVTIPIYDKKRKKWIVFYDTIWDNDDLLSTSGIEKKEFDTQGSALKIKNGNCVGYKTFKIN